MVVAVVFSPFYFFSFACAFYFLRIGALSVVLEEVFWGPNVTLRQDLVQVRFHQVVPGHNPCHAVERVGDYQVAQAHGPEQVVGVAEAEGFVHREGRAVHVRLEVHFKAIVA